MDSPKKIKCENPRCPVPGGAMLGMRLGRNTFRMIHAGRDATVVAVGTVTLKCDRCPHLTLVVLDGVHRDEGGGGSLTMAVA